MFQKKRLIMPLILIVALPLLLNAQQNTDQLDNILQKSAAEIQQVQSAYYEASYKNNDERKEHPIIIKGKVWLKKLSKKDPVGAKTKLKVDRISPKDTTSVLLYYNGQKEIVLSPKDKEGAIFHRPAILKGNIMGQLVNNIFLSDAPFDSTLDRITDFKMEKTDQVDGKPCYVFTLFIPDNKYLKDIQDTWYISKDDYLPRKHIGQYTFNGKKSITTTEFNNLQVNPDLPDSLFTLSAFPKDYEIKRPADRKRKKKSKLLAKGVKAPRWTLKNGVGNNISLNKYKGQIVILDFWGTWCPPCLKAMPELQRIHEKYNQITVIGISTNEPPNAEPVKFARNMEITYPILLNGEQIIDDYHVRSFPTFYIVGKDGNILYRAAGYGEGTGKKIEQMLEGIK